MSNVLDSALPRISGRIGKTVDLNVDFYNNGSLADPYAIRKVEIYRAQVLPHNLVVSMPVLDPTESLYPLPLVRHTIDTPEGQCGTEPAHNEPVPGRYHLPFSIPTDFTSPEIYFDVWYYYPENPCEEGTEESECNLDSPENLSKLIRCCHRFWVYPDEWFCNDGLQNLRLGFEPLDIKFYKPESRYLEIGLMPLPLYDYNYNLVSQLIPFLKSTITVETHAGEIVIDDEECRIGIRQGSYRSNPFVLQYLLKTESFFKGTYQYFIKVSLPDGTTRVSKRFILTIH